VTPASQSGSGTYRLLTGSGPAAIAVVEISGEPAVPFIARQIRLVSARDAGDLRPGQVLRAQLLDADGAALDDILLTVDARQPAPRFRLHLHGNPSLVKMGAALLEQAGFQPAQVGESSPAWPVADTLESEALALLPQVLTLRGAGWVLDQTRRLRSLLRDLAERPADADVGATCAALAQRFERVAWFTRPARVLLLGPPNAGKSTLANTLADRAASVVSPTPGTTRDWVETPSELDGFPVAWVDTAGLRRGEGCLEEAGTQRVAPLPDRADAVVLVVDGTVAGAAARAAFLAGYGNLRPACVAINKCDLEVASEAVRQSLPEAWRARAVAVSALTREGLEAVGAGVLAGLGRDAGQLEPVGAMSARQAALLRQAGGGADSKVLRDLLLAVIAPAAAG
jgi:tRNA modification GTPase